MHPMLQQWMAQLQQARSGGQGQLQGMNGGPLYGGFGVTGSAGYGMQPFNPGGQQGGGSYGGNRGLAGYGMPPAPQQMTPAGGGTDWASVLGPFLSGVTSGVTDMKTASAPSGFSPGQSAFYNTPQLPPEDPYLPGSAPIPPGPAPAPQPEVPQPPPPQTFPTGPSRSTDNPNYDMMPPGAGGQGAYDQNQQPLQPTIGGGGQNPIGGQMVTADGSDPNAALAALPPRLRALVQSGQMSLGGAVARNAQFQAGALPGQQQQKPPAKPGAGGGGQARGGTGAATPPASPGKPAKPAAGPAGAFGQPRPPAGGGQKPPVPMGTPPPAPPSPKGQSPFQNKKVQQHLANKGAMLPGKR